MSGRFHARFAAALPSLALLAAGGLVLAPSCVAACPMRALDFGPCEEMSSRYPEAAGFPLPDPRLTEPALRLTPHPAAPRSEADGEIANVEEVEG